jgi:hypothetical protein
MTEAPSHAATKVTVYTVGGLVAQDAPFAPPPGVENISFINDCDGASGYCFVGATDR